MKEIEMQCLTLPFFKEIEKAQSILLAGAGGGFDIFSGLPLYFGLRNRASRYIWQTSHFHLST